MISGHTAPTTANTNTTANAHTTNAPHGGGGDNGGMVWSPNINIHDKGQMKLFLRKQTQFLATTRFNHSTWDENVAFRLKYKHKGVACIYASPHLMNNIPRGYPMYILEMNNETNRILGIGLVINQTKYRISVYENNNYNRYVFVGKKRVSREELTEKEELMFRGLDALCFTEKWHSKRSDGLSLFPTHFLWSCFCILGINLTDYMDGIFKRKYIVPAPAIMTAVINDIKNIDQTTTGDNTRDNNTGNNNDIEKINQTTTGDNMCDATTIII